MTAWERFPYAYLHFINRPGIRQAFKTRTEPYSKKKPGAVVGMPGFAAIHERCSYMREYLGKYPEGI